MSLRINHESTPEQCYKAKGQTLLTLKLNQEDDLHFWWSVWVTQGLRSSGCLNMKLSSGLPHSQSRLITHGAAWSRGRNRGFYLWTYHWACSQTVQ